MKKVINIKIEVDNMSDEDFEELKKFAEKLNKKKEDRPFTKRVIDDILKKER